MLAGSVIGVPGPVARTRPPWTCRVSIAVGGRYRPTLVRSSPSSGAISTRSPTTMRRLGDSSGMGSSIQRYPPAGGRIVEVGRFGEAWGLKPPCDVDHVHRLTGPGAALLMRPCRRVSADAVLPLYRHEGTLTYAKRPDGAVELDSADRVGLDLGRPVVDHRLADVRVPHGAQRWFCLGNSREGTAALVPHVRPRGGCVGHDGFSLYHPVPPRTHGAGVDGLADVVVGRGADGVVLLGGHGALPDRVRRLDLGAAQARRGADLPNREEPGPVAVCAARFVVAPAGCTVARL